MCCKIAGDFREPRNRAAKLQETFASRENVSQNCRRLSQTAKARRKVAGDFRKPRNRVAKLQETFANRETVPQSCRSISAKLRICTGNASD